jgi:hypothetical protein
MANKNKKYILDVFAMTYEQSNTYDCLCDVPEKLRTYGDELIMQNDKGESESIINSLLISFTTKKGRDEMIKQIFSLPCYLYSVSLDEELK